METIKAFAQKGPERPVRALKCVEPALVVLGSESAEFRGRLTSPSPFYPRLFRHVASHAPPCQPGVVGGRRYVRQSSCRFLFSEGVRELQEYSDRISRSAVERIGI